MYFKTCLPYFKHPIVFWLFKSKLATFLETVINKFCNSPTALYSIIFMLLLFASLLYIFVWICICGFFKTVILINYVILRELVLFASLL